ncbi:MAG: SulP family inorganic anion transporter, partial [Bryobacteraceae bacterium]
LVLATGLIQLVAGILRAGQLFRAISPSVIYGMLAGIGILIFAAQFHVMVDDEPRASGLMNLISIPESVYKGVFPLEGDSHHLAAFVGITTILVLLGWNQFAPKKLKLIPGALVGVVVATTIAVLGNLPIRYVQLPGSLVDSLNITTMDAVARLLEPNFLFAAFAMAFVASAETLLSAAAVDQMHDGVRANYDKELRAQGMGNTLCGVVGALPMTGVIVRSATNVAAGATSRLSTIFHGTWLLGLVAMLPFVLEMVPTASLAAVLVYTGYKLVNPANVRRLLKYGGAPVAVYAATVTVIVVVDLLTGILVGLALSIAKLIYAMAKLHIHVERNPSTNRVDLSLSGAATFIRLPKLADTLESIPPGSEVHIHFKRLDYIDHAAIETLSTWEEQKKGKGYRVVIEWDELMHKYNQKNSLRPDNKSANSTEGSYA